MKRDWKRILCLLLSGVLLLGMGPVPVLAAEEELVSVIDELAYETEIPQIMEFETNIVDPVASSLAEEDEEEEEPETPVELPLRVNGVQVTTANAWDVLEDGTVSYWDGVLTLNNAEICAEGQNYAIYAEESLTILLYGANSLSTQAQSPAIYAEKDLIIESTEPSALLLTAGAGSALRVQADTAGLTIGSGVHVKISATGSGDAYAFEDGYVKFGEGAFTQGTASWTADGSSLEFIGSSHLGDWTRTETEHYQTCAKADCPLSAEVKLGLGDHDQTAEANCMAPAQCSICGAYGEKNLSNHTGADMKYEIEEETHLLVHACCEQPVADAAEEDHQWETVLTDNGAALVTWCSACRKETNRITVKAPAANADGRIVWDGEEKAVTVENGEAESVTYFSGAITEAGGSPEAPTEPGTYVAVVTLAGQKLEPVVMFTIEKKSLADLTMEEIQEMEYTGTERRPSRITVKDGEVVLGKDHYDITYFRQADDSDVFTATDNFVDAGIIRVMATAKPDDTCYTGSISTDYKITKAGVPGNAFAPEFSKIGELTYDGSRKSLSCRKSNLYAGNDYGKGTVEFYRGTDTKVDAVDAGTYQVKIRVAESRNYRETLLENEEWKLTILPTAAYQDYTKVNQLVGEGAGEFAEPTFTGVQGEGIDAPEALSGTVCYRYGDGLETEKVSDVRRYLEGLADGTKVQIQYTFTPDSGNYLPATGTIQVIKVQLTFQMEDGTDISANDLIKENPTYGDADLVDVSNLTAIANGATDGADEHFCVKFAMLGRSGYDVKHLLDTPNAGSAQFFVFYNNPDLGGIQYENIEVAKGYLTIARKTPMISEENRPTAEPVIVANGNGTPLLLEENKGCTDDGLPLEYSLKKSGPYSVEIPVTNQAGLHKVWYRPAENENYTHPSEPECVMVVAAPSLTATYQDTLADIQDQLPEGFSFSYPNALVNEAGNAGTHTVKLDFAHAPEDSEDQTEYPTLTGFAVPLTVEPKMIKAEIHLSGTHYRYTVQADGTPVEKEPPVVRVTYETENGTGILPAREYQVYYGDNRYPGYGIVGITSGNYQFTADSVVEKNFIIYRPGIYGLAIVPETLQGTFGGVDALKEAMKAGLTEQEPDGIAYYNVKMQAHDKTTGSWSSTADEAYCPEEGFSFVIDYPAGTSSATHTFEAVGISTMSQAASHSVTPVTIAEKNNGIEFQMDGYAAVCLAWKEIPDTTEYTIKRNSSTRGNITFTVGDDPTPQTAAKARAGERITVRIQNVKSGYEITRVEYYQTEGGYHEDTSPDLTRSIDGTYSFEMPAHHTSIKVTFRKSSGNPRTGDLFHPGFWMALMGTSAVTLVLLLHRRKKKRF